MIKKEFGVRIELDDDQVMARVFAYAAQSESDELKHCANALMQQLVPGQQGDKEKPTADVAAHASAQEDVRVYRGQVVRKEKARPQANRADDLEEAPARKNVIYRGRRVG
jgi:hypothetical protein